MKSILQTKNSTDYLENIKVLLNSKLCSHELKVEFAVFVASDLEEYYDAAKYPEVKAARQRCLGLATKWLVDKNSVTQEELRVVVADAVAVANAATNAAVAATDAAYAAADDAVAAAYITADAAYLQKLYNWLFTRLTENLNTNTIKVLYDND